MEWTSGEDNGPLAPGRKGQGAQAENGPLEATKMAPLDQNGSYNADKVLS